AESSNNTFLGARPSANVIKAPIYDTKAPSHEPLPTTQTPTLMYPTYTHLRSCNQHTPTYAHTVNIHTPTLMQPMYTLLRSCN
ncbi:hypothetical protein SARC_16891, partial [Sphaeroforma arctica JP610]